MRASLLVQVLSAEYRVLSQKLKLLVMLLANVDPTP
jgi:hypothetical protein